MKSIFYIITLFTFFSVQSQETINQPDLNASYQLPKDWKAQAYYKGNWDKPSGSGVCQCALSINIFKVSNGIDLDYINMVVYPSDKKGAADPKRNQVWQYKITCSEKTDSVHTENLQWLKHEGKLTCIGDNRFKDCIAWKYQSHSNNDNYYTVYFWAKPTLLDQYKASIDKIISSFKPIKE